MLTLDPQVKNTFYQLWQTEMLQWEHLHKACHLFHEAFFNKNKTESFLHDLKTLGKFILAHILTLEEVKARARGSCLQICTVVELYGLFLFSREVHLCSLSQSSSQKQNSVFFKRLHDKQQCEASAWTIKSFLKLSDRSPTDAPSGYIKQKIKFYFLWPVLWCKKTKTGNK